ncbi:MAG TPA: N-acetyltransferase [Candidatus Brocadiia bacterium]|nr:N-acetyltransferase [Candidatus Brocadiia bacterium]
MEIRKAAIADVPNIHKLVNHWAGRERMLARALSEIYENLRDFVVCEENGAIIACGALHIIWSDLGEIKSLAVAQERVGSGVGRAVVEVCLTEARALGLQRVFALTYEPEFFEKCGFRRVSKDSLPQKIWSECVRCPKFPDCDEVAVIYGNGASLAPETRGGGQ